jgi:hypothetical protein
LPLAADFRFEDGDNAIVYGKGENLEVICGKKTMR